MSLSLNLDGDLYVIEGREFDAVLCFDLESTVGYILGTWGMRMRAAKLSDSPLLKKVLSSALWYPPVLSDNIRYCPEPFLLSGTVRYLLVPSGTFQYYPAPFGTAGTSVQSGTFGTVRYSSVLSVWY